MSAEMAGGGASSQWGRRTPRVVAIEPAGGQASPGDEVRRFQYDQDVAGCRQGRALAGGLQKRPTMKLLSILVAGWSMSLLGCLDVAPELQPFEIPSDDKAGGFKYAYRPTEIIPIEETHHGDGALRDEVEAIETGPKAYELRGPIYQVELGAIEKMAFAIKGKGFNSSNMGYMVVVMDEAGNWGPIRALPYTEISIEDKDKGFPGSLPAKDAGNRVRQFSGAATSVNVSSGREWTLDYKVDESPEYPDGAFRRVFLDKPWTPDSGITIGLLPTPLSHWWSIEGTNRYEMWFISSVDIPVLSDMP